jgi:hypothetical protein
MAAFTRPPESPEARRERGRVGALTRSRPPNDPELVAARRFLVVDALVQHARQLAAELTPSERARIAAILYQASPAEEAATTAPVQAAS